VPAAIFVTKEQLKELAAYGEDVVINEVPVQGDNGLNQDLLIWVMSDEDSARSRHINIVLDRQGRELSRMPMSDVQEEEPLWDEEDEDEHGS
jgi:hypothetical protein